MEGDDGRRFADSELVDRDDVDRVGRSGNESSQCVRTTNVLHAVDAFLARDVICTSRAYATMSVSVCLSVCDGSALAHCS